MSKQRMSYQEAIRYLYGLQKFGIKFGLSKTENLLRAFGNPHRQERYIHIAGSNGKGSVASFLVTILMEAGLKVGLYTSPHLVRFTERFQINREEISREKAAALIEELKGAFVPQAPPTFFEATTAMALLYFAREDTDIAIMEVGMGGRLDATNVIKPLISVITNISMEHEFFLGSRLLDIAYEKGGIIKKGVDVVTGVKQGAVIALFQDICRSMDARLWRVGKDIRYRLTPSGFHYYGLSQRFNRLKLGLSGSFQARNAALAVGVTERLHTLGINIRPRDIRAGLKKSFWPGRMQVVAKNPTIILDGAHNPAAARTLANAIRKGVHYRRMILVIGIMQDKNIRQVVRAIVPLADYVFYTRPLYERAAEPQRLWAEAASLERPGKVVPMLAEALNLAKEMAHPSDLILVCGSLFTVGEAMSYLDPEKHPPEEF